MVQVIEAVYDGKVFRPLKKPRRVSKTLVLRIVEEKKRGKITDDFLNKLEKILKKINLRGKFSFDDLEGAYYEYKVCS